MRSMVLRLVTVIVVVVFVQGAFYVVDMQPPEVVFPEVSLKTMPMQFGAWEGEEIELDSKIFAKTGAHESVDRSYREGAGQKISVHSAAFENPTEGLYHSPMNCYRSNGWTKLNEKRIPLKTENRPEIEVSVSTWEKKGERILVLYWYELGDYCLYERHDVLKVRWAMWGQKTWPPMYKVLMQTTASSEKAQAQLIDLSGYIHEWLGGLNNTSAPATN